MPAGPPATQPGLGPVAERLLRDSLVGVIAVKTVRPLPVEFQSEIVGQAAISILVDKWFAENTYHADEFDDLQRLLRAQTGAEAEHQPGAAGA